MEIRVGTKYTTTNPNIPEVRVICELSRETDKNGRIIGGIRGYQAQVQDGIYHAPIILDKQGFFEDIEGGLDKPIKE